MTLPVAFAFFGVNILGAAIFLGDEVDGEPRVPGATGAPDAVPMHARVAR